MVSENENLFEEIMGYLQNPKPRKVKRRKTKVNYQDEVELLQELAPAGTTEDVFVIVIRALNRSRYAVFLALTVLLEVLEIHDIKDKPRAEVIAEIPGKVRKIIRRSYHVDIKNI